MASLFQMAGVDENFLNFLIILMRGYERIIDLKAKIELYHRVLRDNDRHISELTGRIPRDLGEFRNRVQEII